MNAAIAGKVHWSFWVIGAVALTWHVMGSANYLLQTSAEFVAGLPDTHRAIINGRPVWATGGFAVAVFGGAIGSLLLLLRKSSALYLFVASLFGVLMAAIHTVNVAMSNSGFTGGEVVVMIVLPVVVAALLTWYSAWARGKGWTR